MLYVFWHYFRVPSLFYFIPFNSDCRYFFFFKLQWHLRFNSGKQRCRKHRNTHTPWTRPALPGIIPACTSPDLRFEFQIKRNEAKYCIGWRSTHSLSKTKFWLVLCDWLCSDRWQKIKQTGSPAEQRRAVGNSPLCLLQTACAPSITLSLTQPVHNVADKPEGLDQHTQEGLISWLEHGGKCFSWGWQGSL